MRPVCNEDALFLAAATAFALSLPSVLPQHQVTNTSISLSELFIDLCQISSVATEVNNRAIDSLKSILQLPASTLGYLASDRHHVEHKVI